MSEAAEQEVGLPIDLRSDTVTRPSPGMRQAMAEAEVGDDVYGEDPTVKRLEARAAALLGKEAALFVPSGSMANQIALKVHCQPGDDVIVGEGSHNMLYESGAGGAIAGVQWSVVGKGGTFTARDAEAAIKPSLVGAYAPTRLICVENTHNRGGGRIWPGEDVREILAFAREKGLATHLDGARLWNAAAATGRTEKELAAGFDTVSVCLSKGLGAPVGSLICGSKDRVWRAHRIRKVLGGGMRQAGILAAAGLYALEHHRSRLGEDHANARRLAELLARSQRFRIDLEGVQTNIVIADLDEGSVNAETLVARGRSAGVLLNAIGPRRIRLVTHLDVDHAACERAAEVLIRVAAA
jgi:threonine aldolase